MSDSPSSSPSPKNEGSKKIQKIKKKPVLKKPVKKDSGKALKPGKKRFVFLAPGLVWRLGAAALVGLGLALGIFWMAGRLGKLVLEIEQKRSQLTALSEKEENFRDLSSGLKAVEKEIPLLEKAMPGEKGVVDFLDQLKNLEAETEVEVKTLNFGSDRPRLDTQDNSYLELVIKADGEAKNLEAFSQKLLALPVLIRAKTIDFNKVSEPVSEMVLRAWLYVDPDFFKEAE